MHSTAEENLSGLSDLLQSNLVYLDALLGNLDCGERGGGSQTYESRVGRCNKTSPRLPTPRLSTNTLYMIEAHALPPKAYEPAQPRDLVP